MNSLDAASMAMMFPIIHRTMRGRSGQKKRIAAQIIADFTDMAGDPEMLEPYSPCSTAAAVACGPVARRATYIARSIGKLIHVLGEDHFPDIVQQLCDATFAKSSGMEIWQCPGPLRVLVALGPDRLEGVIRSCCPRPRMSSGTCVREPCGCSPSCLRPWERISPT